MLLLICWKIVYALPVASWCAPAADHGCRARLSPTVSIMLALAKLSLESGCLVLALPAPHGFVWVGVVTLSCTGWLHGRG